MPKLSLDYSRGNDIPAAKMDQAAAFAGGLAPLKVPKMPLAEPPPRDSRFGSPLRLSKVHWVRPEVVVEVTCLKGRRTTCYGRSLIKREDKPARQVVRAVPLPPRRALGRKEDHPAERRGT